MADEKLIMRGDRTSSTLGQHFFKVLTDHGNLVAQIQEVNNGLESMTYSDLLIRGKRLARFLRERGLNSGDKVMICSGNNLYFTPVMLGTIFIGAALAPVNFQYDAVDMVHHLTVIQPNLVICNTEAMTAMSEAVRQAASPFSLVSMETVKLAMDDPSQDLKKFQLGNVEDPASHVAFVACSSGTSGIPKAIEHTHLTCMLMMDCDIFRFGDERPKEQEVALDCSCTHWGLTQLVRLVYITRGLKQVLLENFSPEAFLSSVEKFKVKYSLLIPPQVAAIAQLTDTKLYDTTSLWAVVYCGSLMNLGLYDRAHKKLNNKMAQMYGMTEAGYVTLPAYDVTDRPGNAGKLYPNVVVKVVDLDTDKVIDNNGEGELRVWSPWMMKSYCNNPEATTAIFDEDGFLHTGDCGSIDQDGFLYILDRIKELIKYKQYKVNVRAIEDVLLAHAGVQEVAIVGIFHAIDYERATGFVVRRPGSEVTERQLQELVEAQLRACNWLHGGVHFVDSIPKTATGKVQKRLLKEMITSTTDLNH